MGKNDRWIAATTHALQAELIMTDKDFIHSDNVFFKVNWIQ
jgi:predicted nucleic acid-binding protein